MHEKYKSIYAWTLQPERSHPLLQLSQVLDKSYNLNTASEQFKHSI